MAWHRAAPRRSTAATCDSRAFLLEGSSKNINACSYEVAILNLCSYVACVTANNPTCLHSLATSMTYPIAPQKPGALRSERIKPTPYPVPRSFLLAGPAMST